MLIFLCRDANNLKCMSFDLRNTSMCENLLNKNTSETTFCASPIRENTCFGDEGGPLVCKKHLVGIIQNSEECGKSTRRLFTKIDVFLDWINKTLESVDVESTQNYTKI